jgi:cytidylate kinase
VSGRINPSYGEASVLVLFVTAAIEEMVRRLSERESSTIARVVNFMRKKQFN